MTEFATRGTKVSYGEYGLKTLDHAMITARQLEAARRAMSRHISVAVKSGFVYSQTSNYQKPLEVRMGSGKGNVEYWVARVQPGRVLLEIEGVSEELAREALTLAASKIASKNSIHSADGNVLKASELMKKSEAN